MYIFVNLYKLNIKDHHPTLQIIYNYLYSSPILPLTPFSQSNYAEYHVYHSLTACIHVIYSLLLTALIDLKCLSYFK